MPPLSPSMMGPPPLRPTTPPPTHHIPPPPPPSNPSPQQATSSTVSPLNNIPGDIALHRSLLFALDTPVQLTPSVWDKFWPFIDNVWCVHQKPHPSSTTGIAKVYGGCRLNRKMNLPPPVIHENSRPRQRREGGTCKAKFKLTIYPDGRKVVERTGEGHSHTLEHIDGIKRNSGVRNLVLDDFFKSWEAGGILAFLRDTSMQTDGRDLLREAGGLFLSRQEVQNIMNGALKKAYPGQDISEVKKQMDKYKNYTTCNHKGCSAPAFPDIKSLMEHRKTVHGLQTHSHEDKKYTCPERSCWRRKKSKGFATVLGLEEHMKEKHGARQAARIIREVETREENESAVDPLLVQNLEQVGLNALAISNLNIPMVPPLLPDPITPDSGNEEHPLQSEASHTHEEQLQAGAQKASRVLSAMEKENMKMRIKRLMIARCKLDQEINKLNLAVYGNEVGEEATDGG